MELEVFDIIVFVTGIILGFAGALLFRAVTKKGTLDSSQSAGATIEALQHELERRQVLADDHFLQLNAHISAAEKKLADVKKAVIEGASALSTVQLVEPEAENQSTDETNLAAPPRDYAAKGNTEEEGMLSEGFGLHKKKIEEPNRAI